MDFATMMQRANDPAFLEQLSNSPIDPNVIMSLGPPSGAPGGVGMQMPNPQNPSGLGFQSPGVNPPQPTQAGAAGLMGDTKVAGPTPSIDPWAALAASGLTPQPQPAPPMAQPEMMAYGPTHRAQVQPFNTQPRQQRGASLGELLASFRGGQ